MFSYQSSSSYFFMLAKHLHHLQSTQNYQCLPYSGKFSREKTFANWQINEDFAKKTFMEQSNQYTWVWPLT